MRRQEWLSNRQKLETLFNVYDQLPDRPSEVKAHWIRYLIVRTSGFVETSIADLYNQYSEDKASPRIVRFVDNRLGYPGNMKMERITNLANEFGSDWREEIETHQHYAEIKAAVNSIVAIRNSVAHGQDLSTGMTQLRGYYDWIIVLLELLYEQCDRETNTQRWTRRQRRSIRGG